MFLNEMLLKKMYRILNVYVKTVRDPKFWAAEGNIIPISF